MINSRYACLFTNLLIGAPPQAEMPMPPVASSSLPAPIAMSVPPIDSLSVDAATPKADKGKQPVRGTRRAREDDSDDESKTPKTTKKKRKLTMRLSKADADEDDGQVGKVIYVVQVCLSFLLSFILSLTEP